MAYDPNRFRSEERIAIMALDMLGRSFDYQVKKSRPGWSVVGTNTSSETSAT